MDTIDAKAFAMIAAITVAVVGALKKAWPTYVKGKEDFLNLLLPILFIVTMKTSGQLVNTEWMDGLIWAVAAGPVAGLMHDKVVNPVIKSTVKKS